MPSRAAVTTHASYGELSRLFEEIVEIEQRLQADQALQHALVARCRELGATWSVIGESLGISFQTAQKRYGGARPPAVHRVRAKRDEGEPPIEIEIIGATGLSKKDLLGVAEREKLEVLEKRGLDPSGYEMVAMGGGRFQIRWASSKQEEGASQGGPDDALTDPSGRDV